MKDLILQSKALRERREESAHSQALTQMNRSTELVVAASTNQIHALEDVTATAMMAVGSTAALEAHLVGLTPHAEGRLRHIADTSALQMARIVARTVR